MFGDNQLVGFRNLKELLAMLKKDERAYQVCRLPLSHLLMELEKGNGQSHLTECIAVYFKENDLRSFGGLDLYLEYHMDGSLKQLQEMFKEIRVNAVYSPYFEGVIAIDVSELGHVVNEEQMIQFISGIKEVMLHATVIFFVSPNCQGKQALKKRLTEELRLKEIEVKPYSQKEYVVILLLKLRELGIRIRDIEKQKETLLKLIQCFGVNSVKEAVRLAQLVAFKADYSEFVPVLWAEGTAQVLEEATGSLSV